MNRTIKNNNDKNDNNDNNGQLTLAVRKVIITSRTLVTLPSSEAISTGTLPGVRITVGTSTVWTRQVAVTSYEEREYTFLSKYPRVYRRCWKVVTPSSFERYLYSTVSLRARFFNSQPDSIKRIPETHLNMWESHKIWQDIHHTFFLWHLACNYSVLYTGYRLTMRSPVCYICRLKDKY